VRDHERQPAAHAGARRTVAGRQQPVSLEPRPV